MGYHLRSKEEAVRGRVRVKAHALGLNNNRHAVRPLLECLQLERYGSANKNAFSYCNLPNEQSALQSGCFDLRVSASVTEQTAC